MIAASSSPLWPLQVSHEFCEACFEVVSWIGWLRPAKWRRRVALPPNCYQPAR